MTGTSDKERLEKFGEQLEVSHSSIREIVTVEVAAAVKGAMSAMQQSLVNRFVGSFEKIAQQHDEKLQAAVARLEGRITRSRDTQESLISAMRDDQLKFQSDIRSTIANIQTIKQKQKGGERNEEGFILGEGSSTAERRVGFGVVGSGLKGGSGVNRSGYGGISGYGAGSGSGGGPGHGPIGKNA